MDKNRWLAERKIIHRSLLNERERSLEVDIAADPVIPYMTATELERSIERMRLEMVDAAKKMEFIEAARLRDEVLKMEHRLNELNNK